MTDFGWGDDIAGDVEYYRARERGLVWLRRAQRYLLGAIIEHPTVSLHGDVGEMVRDHLAVCGVMPECHRGCWGEELTGAVDLGIYSSILDLHFSRVLAGEVM